MAKILLVEDDSNLREIYGARLEAEGYQIFSASDGEEALALAVQEQPDLVVSDVMMPKISGFDMLDILRTTPETKNVKVVVMTALGQDEDKQRGEQLGADRYIVKSQVTLDDVVQIVHEVLGDNVAASTTTPGAVPPAASDAPQVTAPIAVATASDSPVDDQAVQAPTQAQQPPAAQPDPTPQATPMATTDAATDINSQVADFVANSPLMNQPTPIQQPPVVPQDNDSPATPAPQVDDQQHPVA